MTNTTPAPTRRSRRILVPLATLAAAGALVVGSGADFTSQSKNAESVVASGTLTQSNSRANEAIFNVSNIKPGDTVTGSVVLTNTGSLPASFKVTETATNGFADQSNLQMTITETGPAGVRPVFSGTFGGPAGDDVFELGRFEANEARTYAYTVTLKSSALNTEQGKSANAAYVWDAIQTSAVTVAETRTVTTAVNANP
jgi:spore coat-associated protein N